MYIPGFSNMLERSEYQGGPARVQLPMTPGIQPSAPPIMQPSIQPSAPPIMQVPENLGGLDARQAMIDEREMAVRANPSRTPGVTASAQSAGPQYDPVTGLRISADGQQGYQFMTDRGRAAGYGSNPSGFIAVDPTAQYRMFDERGKNKIVASGTGQEGLQQIYGLANQYNKEQGKKANYGIERLNPATGKWERIAENDPAKGLGVIGDIAGVALPIGAALLTAGASIPVQMAAAAAAGGLGAAAKGNNILKGAVIGGLTAGGGAIGSKLGTAGQLIGPKAGAVIGSGLGSTAGGLATGQPLGQALKGGALASAGTFAGQQLSGPLRDTGIEIPGFNVAKNFTPGGPIIVPGSTGGLSIPVGAGLGGGSGKPKPPTAEPNAGNIDGAYNLDIDVIGNRIPTGSAFPVASTSAGILGNIGAQLAGFGPDGAYQGPPQEEGLIEVVGDRTPAPILPTAGIGGALGAVAPGVITTVGNDIEVTAPRPIEPVQQDPLSLPLPPLSAISSPTGGQFGADQTLEPPEEKSLGDKLQDRLKNLSVSDYLQLAALGIGALGGGGGRSGGVGTIPGGFGSGFSPVFSGGLPSATLPGATGNFAPRDPATLRPQTPQDYYRYGYGPEQSFFDYVPQGASNVSQAYTGYEDSPSAMTRPLMPARMPPILPTAPPVMPSILPTAPPVMLERDPLRFFEGGEVGDLTGGLGMTSNSYAVNGDGTGRSDEIPALLSDGEYVMDAETVALLGDGSSKAGAKRLDELRVKIRKDKGRKLAKGEFSVNAKRPEQYLKGGRA